MTRQFTAQSAVREQVPLLIGLTGPSGSGKTFSALRLATGIQKVSGGDIYFIDTEARRALHYADRFSFKHVSFGEPFGSLDYLEAMTWCVAQGAGVIVVDSMSHEHEGPGGLVDTHAKTLDRMAGTDYGKRERMQMLAWSEPKQKRRALINGLLQLNANFVFCFRAKESTKPIKQANGKTQPEPQGFVPIAGDEFVFEQTMNALLLPASGGVPTWNSGFAGERKMIKLPEQFAWMRDNPVALSEDIGQRLAEWARGGATKTATALQKTANVPAEQLPEMTPDQAIEALETAPTILSLQGAWSRVSKQKWSQDELDALTTIKDDRKAALQTNTEQQAA